MTAVIICIVYCLLTVVIAVLIHFRLQRKITRKAMAIIAECAWHEARIDRQNWKKGHPSRFDFNNSIYQELWELEIRAENDYMTNFRPKWKRVSRIAYNKEKSECEKS